MFDADLATKALDRAIADREHYKQNVYRCKTAMCYAGFVVHEAGGQWKHKDRPDQLRAAEFEMVVMPNGDTGHVSDIAGSLLAPGTSYGDIYDAFFATIHTPETIRANIEKWAAA